MNFNQIKQYFLYAQKKYQQEKDNGIISEQTYFKKYLVISRLMAQHTIDEYNKACDEYNKLRRMKEQFKHYGIIITTLVAQVSVAANKCKKMKDIIASIGGVICISLDGWQAYGATYDDLYNFCCCSSKTISDMKMSIDEGSTLFSDLVFIHYPDCKNKEDFIGIHQYAPLTLAVKEYMSERMRTACKRSSIRDKVNNKLFEIFPDLEECCLIENIDEFGDKVFTDLNGLPVDFD